VKELFENISFEINKTKNRFHCQNGSEKRLLSIINTGQTDTGHVVLRKEHKNGSCLKITIWDRTN
jgi:hypothetical protein